MAMISCQSNSKLDIQGHRGCRGLLPENSLPAFKKAIELGVHTIELDLAISKDKKVVVSHEPFMKSDYCLDNKGNEIAKDDELNYNFYQMPYDSIKLFDCGSKYFDKFPKQEKVKVYKPLLSEVIELAESLNSNIYYNIEIKADPRYDTIYTPVPSEYVQLVLNVIKKYEIENRVNLQSFDIRILEEVKKQDESIKLALLIDENESIDKKLKSLSFSPEIISPYFKLITKESVGDYQSEGFQIIPWTVNTEADMLNMIAFNVDGIITDYPDVLIKLLNTQG
jgi:glycerophosphoryl diester phosphodiesterase